MAHLYQPHVFGCRGKLGRVGNVKLDEEFLPVPFDCFRAQPQAFGNLRRSVALGKQVKNFFFC